MGDEILRLKPAQVIELIKQGEMEVVEPTPAAIIEPGLPQGGMVERAREILGPNFLGVEAIREMENRLKAVGANVEFTLDNIPPFSYTEQDLQIAKQNGELLVLRAGQGKKANGSNFALNIINFRDLFKKDPNGVLDTPFYSFRNDANDWYKNEDFAKKAVEIQLNWALVKKDPLEDSTSKTWNQQEDVLRAYGEELKQNGASNVDIRRRTAMEVAWDTMLYYTNTRQHLLKQAYDWTSSRTSDGGLVRVGGFGSGGLGVGRWNPEDSYSSIGVCPSR